MKTGLRWGILGTADIATETIRALSNSACHECGTVRAIASRDLQRAKLYAHKYEIPLAFGSYEDLLAAGVVDVVYIPLPNSLHAQWTIRAMETGHHVLCEKPIAISADQALEVAEASKRTGFHVAEAFMYRHHPQWSTVAELISSGSIGDVVSLNSRFTFLLDDPSANPASKELAGGALMDVGCYCVHFSRMITKAEPIQVSAMEKRGEVDEAMIGMMEFPGGVLAQFETGINSFEKHGVEITGTRGSIVLDQPWVPGDRLALIKIYNEDQPMRTITVPPANSYFLQANQFTVDCIEDGPPRWSIADAVANMRVIDALFESAATGKTIAVRQE